MPSSRRGHRSRKGLRDGESIIQIELKKCFATENTKGAEKMTVLIQYIKNFVFFMVISWILAKNEFFHSLSAFRLPCLR